MKPRKRAGCAICSFRNRRNRKCQFEALIQYEPWQNEYFTALIRDKILTKLLMVKKHMNLGTETIPCFR